MILFAQIVGAVIIQAFVLILLFRLAARDEADESFAKAAGISALVVAVAWLMGRLLADFAAPLLNLLITTPIVALFTGWLVTRFCWVSPRRAGVVALLSSIICIACLAGFRLMTEGSIDLAWLMSREVVEEEAGARRPVAAATKEYAPEALKLADLQAWTAARIPFGQLLASLREPFDDRKSPLRISYIKATTEVRVGQAESSRQMHMALRGATMADGGARRIEDMLARLTTEPPFGELLESAELRGEPAVQPSKSGRATMSFVIDCRFKLAPIQPKPEEADPAEAVKRLAAARALLAPAGPEESVAWVRGLVETAMGTAGLKLTSMQELRAPAPVNVRHLRLVSLRIILRGVTYDAIIGFLADLQQNPYCTVHDFSIAQKTGQPIRASFTLEWAGLKGAPVLGIGESGSGKALRVSPIPPAPRP